MYSRFNSTKPDRKIVRSKFRVLTLESELKCSLHYFCVRMDGELVTVLYNNMLWMYDTCHLYIVWVMDFDLTHPFEERKEKKPTLLHIKRLLCVCTSAKKAVVDDTVEMMSVDELTQSRITKKVASLIFINKSHHGSSHNWTCDRNGVDK